MKNPFEEAKKALDSYKYGDTELSQPHHIIEAIGQLQEPLDILKTSDFSRELAVRMMKWDILARLLGVDDEKVINKSVADYSLSIDRKSRKEIIDMATGMGGKKKTEAPAKNMAGQEIKEES
jgi:hypothetical protein